MPLKLQRTLFARFLLSPVGKSCLLVFALLLTTGMGTFTYFYVKYARIIDERLRSGVFSNTSLIYAAPRPLALGDDARGAEIAAYLRRCNYTESNTSRAGWYRLRPDAIEINPGPDAYDQEGAVIKFQEGKVAEINQPAHVEQAKHQPVVVDYAGHVVERIHPRETEGRTQMRTSECY